MFTAADYYLVSAITRNYVGVGTPKTEIDTNFIERQQPRDGFGFAGGSSSTSIISPNLAWIFSLANSSCSSKRVDGVTGLW